MRDKTNVEETSMNAAYITTAKGMADYLLTKEHRGPGDTIDAAAYRLQTRLGVPSSLLMRLRHREVRDMLLSNFIALATAYQRATERMERAYAEEKKMAVDPHILRLASFVVGQEIQEDTVK